MRTAPLASLKWLLGPSDEQAMWRVQMTADEEAFAFLVRRWEEPIRRLCTRMVGDEHLGRDLAQEAFTRVFVKRADYTPGGRFSTWLWRIALNLSYDELRRRRRHPEAPLTIEESDAHDATAEWAGPEDAALTPDAAAAREESADLVRKALGTLPETYRGVLVLRHYEGLKFREIAEVLEIPEGTVKSRMAEALDLLARRLAPVFSEAPASQCRTLTPNPLMTL